MTQPSISVKDGNNSLKTIYSINPNGVANSDNSQPVVIANDQIPLSMQPTRLILDAKRYSYLSDAASVATDGSGTSSFTTTSAETQLSVGGNSQEPGRIYVSGTEFKNGGFSQYMNGTNTAYHNWNEFGSTIYAYGYDPVWWEAEFARLANRGINASRVWITDDCLNSGVVLDADGFCLPPTETFWANVDSLMSIAQTHKIYVMATLITFAHFDIYNGRDSQSYKWHLMLGSEERIQSFIDNYVVPFVVRYKDNPYLWAIDVGNELDWLETRSDIATISKTTCTVVKGSNVLTFDKRLPDYIIGNTYALNAFTSGGGYPPDAQSSGPVLERLNDYQCRVTNTYTGDSAILYSVDQGYTTHPVYYCEGYINWKNIQRYVAMLSAAIHRNSTTLVCIGSGFVANSSDLYRGDKYKDADLMAFTSDDLSKIDFHQPHWYAWMEPWFRLYKSPTAHGMSAKPAVLGEVFSDWAGMNIVGVSPWEKRMTITDYDRYHTDAYGCVYEFFIMTKVNDVPTMYKCISGGTAGIIAPSGSGDHIVDGTIVWKTQNKTWEPNARYRNYALIINSSGADDIGRIYGVTDYNGGISSGSGPGPQGTGTGIVDGTVTWDYIREVTTDEYDLYDYYKNNGWSGVMPWTSNDVDNCQGLYEIDLSGLYPTSWLPSTSYSVNAMALNDSNKWYICISGGTSASSIGPTGTSSDIADGTVHWNYVKTLDMPPWTSAGIAARLFADNYYTSIFPSITSQSWTNEGTSIRQSNNRAWYIPGSNMKVQQNFKFGTSETNLIQRVGLFDSNDGIFLECGGANADLSFVVRINGTDYSYSQSNWNINTLSISGSSDYLDKTKVQTLMMDYNWMYGKNKVGFLVGSDINWAHEFTYGNISNPRYPSNPSLPLRWEIVAEGSLDEIRTLSSYSGFVLSNSGKDSTKTMSYGRGGTSVFVASQAVVEVLALRLSSNTISTLRPKRISVLNTQGTENYMFNWRVVLNPPVTADGIWSSVNGSSCAEVVTSRVLPASVSNILAEGYARGNCDVDLNDIPYLGMTASGVSDVISFQIYSSCWYDSYIYASIEWEEIV